VKRGPASRRWLARGFFASVMLACGSDRSWVFPERADVVDEEMLLEEPAPEETPTPVPEPPPFRFGAGIRALPENLELPGDWRLKPAFTAIGWDDPVSLQQAPGTSYLVVSEREGRLFAFEHRPDVGEKHLVLDLSAHNQGEDDSGLLGVAFHPEFGDAGSPNHGYMYVHYAFRDDPIVGSRPPRETPTKSRLARFTVDVATLVADPASELVLIDQDDQSVWHQGGGLMFHPVDGFLYLSVGDEGSGACGYGNCQRIDKDLFSGVLRIDVDQRGGDVSHSILRQPATGSTANYFIPNDNPFVGLPGVLEEFYALGLRNPYRMTHDPVDDVVWIGEVGQETREELNVLSPGANFQWNVYEGTVRSSGALAAAALGVWTSPLLEFNRREALSVIGGYVYRGRRLPELQGKYVFSDFSRGKIWALGYDVEAGRVTPGDLDLLMTAEFRNRENGITSFGVDRDGELYALTMGQSSQIQELELHDSVLNAPPLLSAVGIFRDLAALEPVDGFVPYSVQSPLWSDGADKRRWLALPEGEKIGFAPEGAWQFPEGTVFVKHFEMQLDERGSTRPARLETRLLVAGAGGSFYGLTYKWNRAGTDAELVTDDVLETLQITESDGSVRSQTYYYPGPHDCMNCHNAAAGYVLGVRTAQLNDVQTVPSGMGQLERWIALDMFRNPLEIGAPEGHASLTALSDDTSSLEERVRSYWDGNCSMCHNVRRDIRANWDARFQTPLEAQGVLETVAENGGEHGATLLIAPGAPSQSILYQRSATSSEGLRMPPLGSRRTDAAYLDVLERWILQL
jgi:uncharacterized repeat protein (TIGR03806 family)